MSTSKAKPVFRGCLPSAGIEREENQPRFLSFIPACCDYTKLGITKCIARNRGAAFVKGFSESAR